METLKTLNELFPYEYMGGGYFRLKTIPKKTPAPILHGYEAVQHIYDAIKKETQNENLHVTI